MLTRDLRAALERLNPDLPASAIEDAVREMTVYDVSRSTVQHNRDFYRLLRGGVPVQYRDAQGRQRFARARVIDFGNAEGSNRFLAVREMKLTGIRTPNYNRRADLVCFVNGLPLVFIELKAVYKNIREGFDNNLSDYMDDNVIAHAFHHNAFLVVSNGDRARYGSITSEWEHFRRMEAARRGGQGQSRSRGAAERHAGARPAPGHRRELHRVRREQAGRHAQGDLPRNHQVLGVNQAVAVGGAAGRAEAAVPAGAAPDASHRGAAARVPCAGGALAGTGDGSGGGDALRPEGPVDIVERAHPDLGRLGVFWTPQGSGKSYSMAFLPRGCVGSWKATSPSC